MNASTMYVAYGLSIFGSDSVFLSPGIYGSSSRGDLSLKTLDDGLENELRLYFDDGIEAMALYLLDGEGDFDISASFDGDYLFEEMSVELAGDNIPGGRFIGLIFSSTVDYVSIRGDLSDGFGIDD